MQKTILTLNPVTGCEYAQQALDFCKKYGVTVTAETNGQQVKQSDVNGWGSDRFPHLLTVVNTVKIQRGRKSMTIDFKISHNDTIAGQIFPSLYDVMACMSLSHCEDFQDFCDNFGYESEIENDWGELKPNKKAKKVWKATKKQDQDLERLFPEDEEIEALHDIA